MKGMIITFKSIQQLLNLIMILNIFDSIYEMIIKNVHFEYCIIKILYN